MDHTLLLIVFVKPFEHGAAIEASSCTKYIGGHGNSIGGIIS